MPNDKKPAITPSNLKSLAEELDFMDRRTSGGPNRYEWRNGDNNLRVLPSYNNRGDWYYRYGMHFNLPVEGDRTSFPCPQLTEQEGPCAFCEAAADFRGKLPDMYSRFRAKLRYRFNVIDLDNPDEGVQMMECGPSVANDILEVAYREGDPTDIENGYNFTISRKSTGPNQRDVEYKVFPDRKSTPLDNWDVLEDLYELDDVNFPSLEEQHNILDGNTVQEDSPAALTDGDTSPPFQQSSPDESDSASSEDARVKLRERLRARS